MSEDLKIQQGPSATPYILGGGGLGAVAGFGATKYIDPVKNFVTEAPKYKSHEDLVNEAKDDFQKVITEVESHEVDDKSFVDKLKAEKANVDKAGAEWEASKAEYIKNGQKEVAAVDTDEIKELNKQLEAAKAKLAESEKALVAASPKEVVVNPTRMDVIADRIKPLDTDVKAGKKVIELRNEITNLTNKLELAKNKGYLEQRQKGLQVEVDNLTSEIQKLINKLDSNPNAANMTKFENLVKDFERKSKELAELKAQNRSLAISIPKANISSEYPQLVKKMQKNEALLEEIAQQRIDLIQRLSKDTNSAELQKELSSLAKKETGIKKVFEELKAKVYNPENLTKEMQEKLAKYNAQETFINDKLDEYARKASQASKKEGGTERSIKQGLAQLRDDIFGVKSKDGKVVKEGLVGLSKSEKEAVFNQAKEQFNDRIALFDRIHGDEIKLSELKSEYGRFSETRRKIIESGQFQQKLAKKEAELKKLTDMQNLAKKREAHIKKMWAQRKEARKLDGKKFVDATFGDLKSKDFKYTSFTDTLNKADKDLLKEIQKSTKKRAPKVIKTTPATEGLAAAVESNKAKVTELTSQIAKKRDALPKQAVKSVEELTAEFVKEKGTKADTVKNATKNALENVKEEFGTWVEKATKTNTGKVAIAAVGAAVIGTVIGLMLKPSKKEA